MKKRLLVIDGNLQDIADYSSMTLSILQGIVPNDVLVVFDEDIQSIAEHVDLYKFSSYQLVSSSADYTRVALEKYHLTETAVCDDGEIETIDDLIKAVDTFYALQPSVSTDYSSEPIERFIDKPCPDKCSSIGTISKPTGRFDHIIKK